MEEPLNEVDYLKQYDVKAYTQVSIATDVVCFSILEQKENNYRKLSQKKLSVLLIKRGEYPDKGKWAWPGGFLKENETLEQTAQRELYEETGAKKFDLHPICIYSVDRENDKSYGQLYYADVYCFDDLPDYEIEKIKLFDSMPSNLTYPLIQPTLLEKVKQFGVIK